MAMSRTAKRGAALLALVLLAALGLDGYRLYRDEERNRAIRSGMALEVSGSVAGEVTFAQARILEDRNERAGALTLYQKVQQDGPQHLRIAARCNSANIYLRQALELADAEQRQLMLPLVELAKENYRRVLRADPAHWDAKYNLERALRLAPEGDDEPPEEAASVRNAERAVTTMRGISLGLP